MSSYESNFDTSERNYHEDRCVCLEGKTRWGIPDAQFAPIASDSDALCQRCGRIRRSRQSDRPNDLETHS